MKKISLLLCFILLLNPFLVWGVSENLDERIARNARKSTNIYYLGESGTTPYSINPQSLSYVDMVTGREIWILTNTPYDNNSIYDISNPTFSADGKWLIVKLGLSNSSRVDESGYNLITIARPDGSYLHVLPSASCYNSARCTYSWIPTIPDVFYEFGRSNIFGTGTYNHLYKHTLTSDDVTREDVGLTFATSSDYWDVWGKNGISGDGEYIFTKNTTLNSITPVNLLTSAFIIDNDGFAYKRPSFNDGIYWGNTLSSTAMTTYHDVYAAGPSSAFWAYVLQEGAATWWRFKTSGSETDGGPKYTHDITSPYSWGGEMEPVFGNATQTEGQCVEGSRSPWSCDNDPATDPLAYPSHFTPDRWGNKSISTYAINDPCLGPSVANLTTHIYDTKCFQYNSISGAQHHDWHGWTDWPISTVQPCPAGTACSSLIAFKYNDGNATNFLVANLHVRENGSTSYNSLPRPGQSPDGTKAIFVSDFLSAGADKLDILWATVFYPYPPEIYSTTATGGTVTVRFDWGTNSGTWRGYTSRKWPDESTGQYLPPRETEKFRLWRSPNKSTWTPIATVDANIFTKYDFADGGYKGGQTSYWDITDEPGNGTWYYALTAIETSGLESKTLSNIFAITISGGSGTGAQDTAYPANPGGDSDFYATAPGAAQSLAFMHKKSPATADGQYTIEWTEPVTTTLLRHYNIYAIDGANPTAIQQRRIASISRNICSGGNCSWVDWLGNTAGTTRYGITAIDTQGNESQILTLDEGSVGMIRGGAVGGGLIK